MKIACSNAQTSCLMPIFTYFGFKLSEPRTVVSGLNNRVATARRRSDTPRITHRLQFMAQESSFAATESFSQAHPGFTNAIGEQLQIAGTKTPAPNLQDAKPTFKALPKVASVILDWVKGKFDGVVIEGRRGTETVFMFLDKDFKSPFEDTRPNLVAGQPEKRRYRMIYLLNDEVVGEYSDEVVITTKG